MPGAPDHVAKVVSYLGRELTNNYPRFEVPGYVTVFHAFSARRLIMRRDLYEDALIMVVSDHGDEFFEHGFKGHRATLYNETLRVPLLVRFPGGRGAGTRGPEAVSVVDLAPAGAEAPPFCA